jgi:hypothetical protein
VGLSGLTPPFRAMRAYRGVRCVVRGAADRSVLHIFGQQGATTFSRSRNSLDKLVQTVRAPAARAEADEDAVKQLVGEAADAAELKFHRKHAWTSKID